MIRILCATLLAVLCVLCNGCGTTRRGPPAARPVAITTVELERGQRLFFAHCNPCHPNGEAGLGPALNDKPLPETAIEIVIRQGPGAMPAFGNQLLHDKDLSAIAEYVEELRQSDQPSG